MPGPDGQRCEDCYYYDPADPKTVLGLCRKHPPAGDESLQPSMYPNDWCGEFKPKLSTSDGVSDEQKR